MRSTLGLGRTLNLCLSKITRQSSTSLQLPPDDYYSPILPNSAGNNTASSSPTRNLSSSSSDLDIDETATPDIAAVFASQRFFFSSPGRSNSIIDSSTTSPQPKHHQLEQSDSLVGGGIAVPKFSPDPYKDFRRSMQEMVEARDSVDVRGNWDYLHELLTCYLALNPKSTHKFILCAFADLLVTLITLPTEGPEI